MKIIAKIEFDTHDRIFIIPCGTGDKSIKWLGIVATQRYTNAAPNGSLRRRDDYCGISDQTQYQVENIILPSGKPANPGMMIFDSELKDGDEIIIKLTSKLYIHTSTGTPNHSKWSTLAFSTLNDTNEINKNLDETEDDMDDIDASVINFNKDEMFRLKSKSDFMRIILHSQMINPKLVMNKVDSVWSEVKMTIPKLTNTEAILIKDILASQWDVLNDLFDALSNSSIMEMENFLYLTRESEIFPPFINEAQSIKIYTRVCKYANIDKHSFKFSSLIIALLLCAQVKYNDTLDPSLGSMKPYESFYELLKNYLLPLAQRLKLQSVLKHEFCSDECLAGIRLMYDDLQTIFNKYASKLQDIPTSVPLEDVTELLYTVGLQPDVNDYEKIKKILNQGVRKGSIFGPSIDSFDTDIVKNENELSFPEFVECIARAGFYKFYDAADTDSHTSNQTHHQIEGIGNISTSSTLGSLLLGVKLVTDSINNTRPKSPPQSKQGKKYKK